MLILQRKAGESIQIGDDISISIAEISGDRVKLAIDAPHSVQILRSELLEAVDSNKEAADIPPQLLGTLKLTSRKES